MVFAAALRNLFLEKAQVENRLDTYSHIHLFGQWF